MVEFDSIMFWEKYTQMQIDSHQEDKSGGSFNYRDIFKILLKFEFRSKNNGNDILLFEDLESSDYERKKEFWQFYLFQSNAFALIILLIDALFITLLVILLGRGDFIPYNFIPDRGKVFSISISVEIYQHILVVYLIHFVCTAYFLVLWTIPHKFKVIFNEDPVTVWVRFARLALFVLILEVIGRIAWQNFESPTQKITDDYVMDMSLRAVVITLMSFMQVLTLYSLPFPWKYFVSYCVLATVTNVVRLQRLLPLFYGKPEYGWLISVAQLNIITASTMLCIFSKVLETSSQESYLIRRRLLKETVEKKRFLNLLYSEIKNPLQNIILSLDNLSHDNILNIVFQDPSISHHSTKEDDERRSNHMESEGLILADEIQWLRKSILYDTMLINWLVNDLMLAMRIEESRCVFKCSDRVDLKSFFNDLRTVVDQLFLSKMMRDSTDHCSKTVSSADIIEFNIPDITIVTSLQCLTILTRCCLIISWNYYLKYRSESSYIMDESFSQEGKKSKPFILTMLLNRLTPPLSDISTHALQITLSWNHDEENQQYKFFSLSTAQFISQKVAQSCNGSAVFNSRNFSLSIGCIFKDSADNDANSELHDLGNNESSGKDKKQIDIQKGEFTICVLNGDKIFGDTILSVLNNIQRFENIPTFDLTCDGFDFVAKFSLLFSSSLSQCQELRSSGYDGLVILFSGELSYLDDNINRKLFDYHLPMPCLDGDISRFTDWFMLQKLLFEVSHRGQDVDHSIVSATGEIKYFPTAPLTLNAWKFLKFPFKVNESGSLWLHQILYSRYVSYFFGQPLPANSEESYTKWRTLNPSKSIFQTTNLVYIVVAHYFVRHSLYSLIISKNHTVYIELQITAIIIFLFKDCIYNFILVPMRIELWKYLGVISFLILIVMQLYVHLKVFPRGYFYDEPPSNCTLSTMLNNDFGEIKGSNMMRFTLSGGYFFNRWMTIYFPWPWNYLLFISDAYTLLVCCKVILRNLMSLRYRQVVFSMVAQFLAYWKFISIRYEYLKKLEFIELYQLLRAQHFLSSCVDICQQDVLVSLNLLYESKQLLITKLCRIIQVEYIKLRKETVMKLEPMFSGGLLLRKLFNELEFSRNLSVRTKKNGDSPLLTMDIVFLSKIVENVISRCSIMSDVVGIKISAKINPELALVRIDRKLFQTILIDAILLAIRNIKNSIRDDPSKQGELHEVLVLCVPKIDAKMDKSTIKNSIIGDSDKGQDRLNEPSSNSNGFTPMRFFDIRYMQLTVMDTSRTFDRNKCDVSTTCRDSSESQSFGQSVINDLIHSSGGDWNASGLKRNSGSNSFLNFRRYTMQYQFCFDTVMAARLTVDIFPCNHLIVARSLSYWFDKCDKQYQSKSNKTPGSTNAFLDTNSSGAYDIGTILRSNRNMELLSSKKGGHIPSTCQLISILEKVWNVRSQYPLEEITLDKRLKHADCVVIDSNVSETCSLTIRDIVIQLRLYGYRNLIVCLCNEEGDEADLSRELTDVAVVDIFVMKPLSNNSMTLISEKCCERIIQEIFLYNQI